MLWIHVTQKEGNPKIPSIKKFLVDFEKVRKITSIFDYLSLEFSQNDSVMIVETLEELEALVNEALNSTKVFKLKTKEVYGEF